MTPKDLVTQVRQAWKQFDGTIEEFAQLLDMSVADTKHMLGLLAETI
jgi:hypothetical protein